MGNAQSLSYFSDMGSYNLVLSLMFLLCLSQFWRESSYVLEENGGGFMVSLKNKGFGRMKVMNSFELLRVSRNISSNTFHFL